MKKILMIAVLGLIAFSCNKDQKAVKQLDGQWDAQFFYTILDDVKSDNLVDPTTTEGSFSMSFTTCKLKKDEFCSLTITDNVSEEEESLTGSWLYRTSGDGAYLELKKADKPFIHKLEIVERTKVNLKVIWDITDDLTLDIQLKKQ
ncbi:hypothetical protein [Crocinitomix catalasitica]|uniref:hypothetical protein n=1 Tax=Crocinitomix catalasitica TaxID=184607 RepID=UPI00048598A9|nr:hypothetical protein [Crocinitomix catalasitica]